MEMRPKEELAENVLSLFFSAEYSDLTITSRDEKFKVHKALVCSRSEYFRKACKSGVWKEGQTQTIEVQNDPDIPVPMDDPVLLKYMIQYLYGQDYMKADGEYRIKVPLDYNSSIIWGRKKLSPQTRKGERLAITNRREIFTFPPDPSPFAPAPGLPSPGPFKSRSAPIPERSPPWSKPESDSVRGISCRKATLHAQMYALADFYGIPTLQEFTRQRFRSEVDAIHDDKSLVEVFKLVCKRDYPSDAVIRDLMVDKIAKYSHLLDEPDVAAILNEDGELTLTIAKAMRPA